MVRKRFTLCFALFSTKVFLAGNFFFCFADASSAFYDFFYDPRPTPQNSNYLLVGNSLHSIRLQEDEEPYNRSDLIGLEPPSEKVPQESNLPTSLNAARSQEAFSVSTPIIPQNAAVITSQDPDSNITNNQPLTMENLLLLINSQGNKPPEPSNTTVNVPFVLPMASQPNATPIPSQATYTRR